MAIVPGQKKGLARRQHQDLQQEASFHLSQYPNSWLLEPGTGSQRTFQAENTVWAKAQRWRSMCSAWETAWEKQGRAGVAVAAMTLVRPAKA